MSNKDQIICPHRKSRRLASLPPEELDSLDQSRKGKRLINTNRESTDSGVGNCSDYTNYRDPNLSNIQEDYSPSSSPENLEDSFVADSKGLTETVDQILKLTESFDKSFRTTDESKIISYKKRTSEDIVSSVAEGSGSIPPSPVKSIDGSINLPPSPVKRTKRKSLVNQIDATTLIGRYFQIEEEVKRTSESLKPSVAEGVEGTSTSTKEVRDYRPSAFDMSIRIREPNIFHGTPDEDGQEWLSRFEI